MVSPSTSCGCLPPSTHRAGSASTASSVPLISPYLPASGQRGKLPSESVPEMTVWEGSVRPWCVIREQ